MKGKKYDQKAFEDFKKNILESFLKFTAKEDENKSLKIENNTLKIENDKKNAKIKSQEAKINSLTIENNIKEYTNKIYKKENIYAVNKEVYKAYDSLQNDTIEMETEKNETKSIELSKMFQTFKDYVEQIDIISDKIGSISNHEENKDENEEKKLLSTKEINDIINHEFGKNLEKNEFLEAFRKAILNNVNKNWIKDDRIDFKNKIKNMSNSQIKEIFSDQIPNHIIQLRMDILLSTSLTKVYNTSSKFIDFLIIKESINYSKNPLEKGIRFKNPENLNDYLFNKEYIKYQINNNVGILNAYYKLIQKFVSDKYQKDQLTTDLNDIIDKTNIFFCDLPKKVLGITICNGDIFISGKYLQEALHNSPDNKYFNPTGVSKIYLTLLHEISHKLQYTLRKKDHINDNYFIKTFYFKKENDHKFDIIEKIILEKDANNCIIKPNVILTDNEIMKITEYHELHGNITIRESGIFFDQEIYLGKVQNFVTKSITNFFLFGACQNYCDYVSIMKSFLDNINGPGERTTNCSYKLIDDNKVYCYHSLIRGYYN